MRKNLRNYEGIVLRSRPGREGGRSLFVFTREAGLLRVTAPRGILGKYGTGALLPFSLLRFTAVSYAEFSVANQYEGRPLFDTLRLTYEEMSEWAYVVELTLHVFPIGQDDIRAFQVLQAAGEAAGTRSKMLTAFTAAVQLLSIAGFDPSREEAEAEFGLPEDARVLLSTFRRYSWQGRFPISVSRTAFRSCAAYLDRFILKYCDFMMNTKGAFVNAVKSGEGSEKRKA